MFTRLWRWLLGSDVISYLLPDGRDTGTETQGVADTMVEVTGEEEGETDREAETVSGLS